MSKSPCRQNGMCCLACIGPFRWKVKEFKATSFGLDTWCFRNITLGLYTFNRRFRKSLDFVWISMWETTQPLGPPIFAPPSQGSSVHPEWPGRQASGMLPFREQVHIPPWLKETHRLKSTFGKGYVSSQEAKTSGRNPTFVSELDI